MSVREGPPAVKESEIRFETYARGQGCPFRSHVSIQQHNNATLPRREHNPLGGGGKQYS